MVKYIHSWVFILALLSFSVVSGQKDQRIDSTQRKGSIFYTDVPSHDFDIVLNCPSNHEVSMSLLAYKPLEGILVYYDSIERPIITETFELLQQKPLNVYLNNLDANKTYFYYILYKANGSQNYTKSPVYDFHTQRAKKEPYVFTMTADSHLDQNSDTMVYRSVMQSIAKDSVDFHIDLGDAFMVDKHKPEYQSAFKNFLAQRYYFGLMTHSAPLFLVLGNHDGGYQFFEKERDRSMQVWAQNIRKQFFPNPSPNEFYSGNNQSIPEIGNLENYYAWNWGDALFVVLDPYCFSKKSDNPWDRSLGEKQYRWLKETLEKSEARFKFVFVHNLVGGIDRKGKARGGVEVARFYEWGGLNADSSSGWQANRSTMEMPIHQLLVKNKVTAVFHGHDHIFAKQELDGVIYQCLPQPASFRSGSTRFADEYGYVQGKIINQPGYLKIKVSQFTVIIDYLSPQGNLLYSYTTP